jgi:predicted nucleic acid-binding protein
VPQIILDTSVVVPRLDERDALRQPAMNLWTALEQQSWSVIFFDCVANETISVLCRRFTERQRLDMWPEAFARFREFCRVYPPSWSSSHVPGMFTTILALIGQHQGRLNFHDALLALHTRELGIPYIASFDHDFDTIPWLKRISSSEDLPLEDDRPNGSDS